MAAETSQSPPTGAPDKPRPAAAHRTAWLALFLYAALLALASVRHEPWGDELHSWNIAKASAGLLDLLANIRYEGHPPLWYVLLWGVSKISHSLAGMKVIQYLLACAVAGLVLFRSPFPLPTRVLILFGYYFLFEYGVLGRNYAIGVLLAFSICLLDDERVLRRYALYYVLLSLLASVHLVACLLAVALHASFLVEQRRRGRLTVAGLVAHALGGAAAVAPTLAFIFPPSDSQLNASFWLQRWSAAQLYYVLLAPLKALLPVPAWWKHHFWNSHFLVDLGGPRPLVRGLGVLASAGMVAAVVFILRGHRRGLVLLATNLALTALAGLFFPLTSARYVGFIFIGFLASCWLSQRSRPFEGSRRRALAALLAVQAAGGLFALQRDVRLPFSNASKVVTLAASVPEGTRTVTDYWCLDNLAAYLDRPFYVLQRQEEVSFMKWDAGFTKSKSYADALDLYARTNHVDSVLMYSSRSPAALRAADARLSDAFDVTLVRGFEGAIETSSDVYLYRIARKGQATRPSAPPSTLAPSN